MPFLLSLIVLAATVFAVIDIVTRDESRIRHMPKALWLILVILLPLLGMVLWFTIGREYPERNGGTPQPVRRAAPRAASRPSPMPAPSPAPRGDTRTTEQQLADLDREIEEERLRAEARRRQAEGGSTSA